VPIINSGDPDKGPKKPKKVEKEEDDPRIKRYRIQRRRLGRIMAIKEESSFGFIEAEDFREDVFFHFHDWNGQVHRFGRTTNVPPEVGLWVQFELDEEHLEKSERLRAKVVTPTDRPSGRKLSGRDATFNIITHHPRARRKRPDWRK
jgi:hypothetical protein